MEKRIDIPMSRKQRRAMRRAEERAAKKELLKGAQIQLQKQNKDPLQSHVTVAEAVQIATSVAMDVVNNYHQQANPVMIGLSVYAEVLKNVLIKHGLISEEEFQELYKQSVDEINRLQEERHKGESGKDNEPSPEGGLDKRQDGDVATPTDVPSAEDTEPSVSQ